MGVGPRGSPVPNTTARRRELFRDVPQMHRAPPWQPGKGHGYCSQAACLFGFSACTGWEKDVS